MYIYAETNRGSRNNMANRNPVKKCPACSWGKCGIGGGNKYCPECGWSNKSEKQTKTSKVKVGK